ncbi:MAG: hypothetical protein M5U08_25675 [Burkholderiales bacterium]|nr:hypothetical protein [Burkholderiales bacterium]
MKINAMDGSPPGRCDPAAEKSAASAWVTVKRYSCQHPPQQMMQFSILITANNRFHPDE